MRWQAFVESAGELGALAEERLVRGGLGMVGTLRADGSPRISPCEVFVVDGELLLGMMWRSRKAQDLLRDPRIAVHSIQGDKAGTGGDVKLYGAAVDVQDPALRTRYADVLEAETNWRPPEPFHLFALDVREAGFISFVGDRRALRWSAAGGLQPLRHPDG
jgi:Pyridoxamine 5'-phosphate oxidase